MNSMYFSKEDVEAGLMQELVSLLCSHSYRADGLYNDVHIRPDDLGAFIVEWAQVPWNHEYGGKFEYVDEDQAVCNEVVFPDKHFEYTPEDPNDVIKEWLEDNPNWRKDEWGHWVENPTPNVLKELADRVKEIEELYVQD